MVEYDSASLAFACSKLVNLIYQVDEALSEEFPNDDVREATQIIKANISKILRQVKSSGEYSPVVQEQILIRANNQISINSYLLGIILRCSATRNPFELYHPFRSLAQSFFPSQSINLIMSSEWDYIPITYPLTIEELPSFIVIGMPAPEADNVLAFPAAGHELGHSIWHNYKMRDRLSQVAYQDIITKMDDNSSILTELFPQFTRERFTDDMFAARLRDMTIYDVLESTIRQCEELFCDLIAVEIFGSSYLNAFRYLLAPTTVGERSSRYPELSERAKIISDYAAKRGFVSTDLRRWFGKEEDISKPFEKATTDIADEVRRTLMGLVERMVAEAIDVASVPGPVAENIAEARKAFSLNTPVEMGMSLGELICAAWEIYNDKAGTVAAHNGQLGTAVSNLVLKSAEAMEFKGRMSVVSSV